MAFNFYAGETLLIDKPYRWSSFKTVHAIKKIIAQHPSWTDANGPHPVKIGHAGTLDPLATGLLILCTGKKTKQLHTYMNLEKVYTGVFFIGATTPCFDREMEVTAVFENAHITPDTMECVRKQFVGNIEQVPPLYSAVQLNGQRAYALARKGLSAELKSRSVCVHELLFTNWSAPFLHFKIRCSKGTYIRSLARDIGIALNSGAYVYDLRREQIGLHSVSEALSPEGFSDFMRSKASM